MKPSCRYSQLMNDNILFTCLPIMTIRVDFGTDSCITWTIRCICAMRPSIVLDNCWNKIDYFHMSNPHIVILRGLIGPYC
jgi:hypothetical protein